MHAAGSLVWLARSLILIFRSCRFNFSEGSIFQKFPGRHAPRNQQILCMQGCMLDARSQYNKKNTSNGPEMKKVWI